MILVSTFSVERGPRAQHAALTIHRAQLEVAAAREATVQDEHPALQKAETELALALIALTERRYDAAVTAAITARQWARAYLDRLAPSPSTRIPQPLAG
jgi:hypothetical protein